MKIVSSTCAILLAGTFAIRAQSPAKPNIIIIMSDDVGYGDVGCYGAQTNAVATPNIDRMASEGLRFTSGYCANSTCTPSRYSLMTGQYAWRKSGTGIAAPNATLIIDTNRTTIADIMKSAGYTTAAIGKWHLGLGAGSAPDWNGQINPGPLELGFDYCFLLPTTGDRVPSVYVENHVVANLNNNDPLAVTDSTEIPDSNPYRLVDTNTLTYPSNVGHKGTVWNGVGRIGYMSGGYAARFRDQDMGDDLLKKALPWMENAATNGTPFFLYFGSQDIHVPRLPNERFQGKSALSWRGDCIVELDWAVGQIFGKLTELGIETNTLVIFCSDNGPVLGDGYADGAAAYNTAAGHQPAGVWRGGKTSIYEGGTRTPFITWWPGRIAPGTVSDQLVCQLDLASSFAALTGQTVTDSAAFPDSFNLINVLLGVSGATGRDNLIQADNGQSNKGFRQGDWKLYNTTALYDLATDPGEQTNVASANPDKLALMLEWRSKLIAVSNSTSLSLVALGGAGSNTLDWMDSMATNFVSFTLSRSTNAGGPYTIIASNLTSSAYTDTNCPTGITSYYTVTTFYSGGTPPSDSNEASAVAAGPPPDTGMLIDYNDGVLGGGHDTEVREGGFTDVTDALPSPWVFMGPGTEQFRDTLAYTNSVGGSYGNNYVAGWDAGSAQRIIAIDTGHVIVAGESYNAGYMWRDATGWSTAESVNLILYYTADNTVTGTATDMATLNSGSAKIVGNWEAVSTNGLSGALGVAGKTLFARINQSSTRSPANCWARVDNVYLKVIPPPAPVLNTLYWGAGTATWNTSTANWNTNADGTTVLAYADTNHVVFDDSSSGMVPFTVALNSTVNPASVTVSNATKDYTIAGSGAIVGTNGLAKSGAGTLTLGNANNSFSGNVTIDGGTVNVAATGTATTSALGAMASSRTVTINSGTTLMCQQANNLFTGTAGGNVPKIVVNGGTLEIRRYTVIDDVDLNGGLLTATASAGNTSYMTYEFYGSTITVGGSSASTISSTFGTTGNAMHIAGGTTLTLDVGDVTAGADLTIAADLRDGSSQWPGTGSLLKTGAGTVELSGTNVYTGATTVNGGTLLVSGSLAAGSAVTVNNSGTLGGVGTINGVVTNNGTLLAGTNGVGTLSANGALTLGSGSTTTFAVDGTVVAHTAVALGSTVAYGGTLNILPSGTFTNGQTFTLFSGAGATDASNFASITGSPGSGLAFSFANGVLSVMTTIVPPVKLTYSVNDSTLSLSWPAGQGWRLEWQTNILGKGLGTDWLPITDSSVSNTNITISKTMPTVFYRLVKP